MTKSEPQDPSVPGIPFDEALRRMVIAPYKQQERGKRKKPKEEAPPKK